MVQRLSQLQRSPDIPHEFANSFATELGDHHLRYLSTREANSRNPRLGQQWQGKEGDPYSRQCTRPRVDHKHECRIFSVPIDDGLRERQQRYSFTEYVRFLDLASGKS